MKIQNNLIQEIVRIILKLCRYETRHVVSELHRDYINIAKSCRTRESLKEIHIGNLARENEEKERERKHAWLVSTFQNCDARRPLSPISAFFNFRKSTYLFSTGENRGRPSQPGSRRWKIEYLVPVERPETSWNWSNIQLLLARAREGTPLIPAKKDVPTLAKNYWQYADKICLQSYYDATFFTASAVLIWDFMSGDFSWRF